MSDAGARQAPVAGDVELHPVADDLSGDVIAYGAQHPLDRCRSEFTHVSRS